MAKTLFAVILLWAATAISSPAQTLSTLVSFDESNGANPYFGSLIRGADGDFYGTTDGGGIHGDGTVFKITAAGKLTTLHRFVGYPTEGAFPYGGLILASNGDFYGTTIGGGSAGYGTIFEVTPTGTFTTLYEFCAETNCADGALPYSGLVQGANGNLYGTTWQGGAQGAGSVFEITQQGILTTLHSFCPRSQCADGNSPYAGLVQATSGNFYGTTVEGGYNGGYAGTVFEITPTGMLTTLYNFCSQPGCADGQAPVAALIQAADGNFYGSTVQGGTNGRGTIFRITTEGHLTTLHSFTGTDGGGPEGALIQTAKGNFYGTTAAGGFGNCSDNYGCGTVFEITPAGTLTNLYSFCSEPGCSDGENPLGGLVQASGGELYGTACGGGNGSTPGCASADGVGFGTVFRLSVGGER